jgi:hypothetical protein
MRRTGTGQPDHLVRRMKSRERRLRHHDGYGVLVGVQVINEPGRRRLGIGKVWWYFWRAPDPQ